MTGLHDLQSDFAASLYDLDREVPVDVTSYNSRRPRRRFNVYRNNAIIGLANLLQAYFPVVTRLVGEEFFRAMARDFIVSDPPRSPILSRYGTRFPPFIQQFPPVQDLPYLADVARLEWLQQRAYHAADRVPTTAGDLASIPPEQMPDVALELHPSVGLVVSPFPVVRIWKANAIDSEATSISLDEGGEAALVVRPHLDVQVVPLPAGADTFLALVMMNHTISEAASASKLADRAFDLQQSLSLLIGSGAIVDFEVRPTQSHRPQRGGNHERIDPQLH